MYRTYNNSYDKLPSWLFVDKKQGDGKDPHEDGNTAEYEGIITGGLSIGDKPLEIFKLFTESKNCKESCYLKRAATLVHTTIVVSDKYESFVIVNDFHGGNGQGDDKQCHSLHNWK